MLIILFHCLHLAGSLWGFHTITIHGRGCQARGLQVELAQVCDSDNAIPTVPPLCPSAFRGGARVGTALLAVLSLRGCLSGIWERMFLCSSLCPFHLCLGCNVGSEPPGSIELLSMATSVPGEGMF